MKKLLIQYPGKAYGKLTAAFLLYFKAQGISKLPASKALQTEIEQLMSEKNSLYNEYREKKENVRELQTVKSNLDKILRREPERGKGRENER